MYKYSIASCLIGAAAAWANPDFNRDGAVDFDDFFLFADVFGAAVVEENEHFDISANKVIDFDDFFIFSDTFGQDLPEGLAPSSLSWVWAHDGSFKVVQDTLQGTCLPRTTINRAWDGESIALFGARNEVVSFSLVLEAETAADTVAKVSDSIAVEVSALRHASGAQIASRGVAAPEDVLDYRGRNVELFYLKYLKILGLSRVAYATYDERHVPAACRKRFEGEGFGTGTADDRDCLQRFFPDIAVPLELESPFAIPEGTNQSIWGDIYIPKDAPAGDFEAVVTILEDGEPTWRIPLKLQVRDFALPDLPAARTMLALEVYDVNHRYTGERFPDKGTAAYEEGQDMVDRHFQMAHRHKISLADAHTPVGDMDARWRDRLSGELFTAARGYGGVGEATGNNLYVIGLYGGWPWRGEGRQAMHERSDAWVEWFEQQDFATPTDYFLYLIDESADYPQIEQWAAWMDANTGPGRRLRSFATIPLPVAAAQTPSLDIVASTLGVGQAAQWEEALHSHLRDDREFHMYNGARPATGSFATEDDGVALRAVAWAQYKRGIHRWFYWNGTYYNNYQGGQGHTDVFVRAQTFGDLCGCLSDLGVSGHNYANGDGVLFYPGTDKLYPGSVRYNLPGPFASVRLKMWRRGVQDVDYLALAAAADSARTAAIVERMVPKVLWEYGVSNPEDPTWVRSDISWPADPAVWEDAREELAAIIEAAQ